MFKGTVKEFAAVMGVEYAVASGMINFLKEKGIVKQVGTRATGRKPANVFEIPAEVTFKVPASPVEEVEVKNELPTETLVNDPVPAATIETPAVLPPLVEAPAEVVAAETPAVASAA